MLWEVMHWVFSTQHSKAKPAWTQSPPPCLIAAQVIQSFTYRTLQFISNCKCYRYTCQS